MLPRIVVGLTGSSGVRFTLAFLDALADLQVETHLVVSKWGHTLLEEEAGCTMADLRRRVTRLYADDDLTAPIASGSVRYEAVVILPCSMTTLARIAHGLGDTLIARCAHVALKERRRLVVCIRETPLSTVNLANALRVSRAGGIIMPMTLAHYLGDRLDDLMHMFALRILSLLGLRHVDQWKADELE